MVNEMRPSAFPDMQRSSVFGAGREREARKTRGTCFPFGNIHSNQIGTIMFTNARKALLMRVSNNLFPVFKRVNAICNAPYMKPE